MFKKAILLVFLCANLSAFAQNRANAKTRDLDTLSLQNQFEFLIKNSNRYQDYKVVKKEWILRVQQHVKDSLNNIQKQFENSQVTIKSQKEKIDSLNKQLSNTQSNVTSLNEEKDAISLFGMTMSKALYNTILWSIIGGLLTLLLFFIYKFKNSNIVTKITQKNLDELEQEFDAHRKRALEREQKVMRKLQDEINKQKKGDK